MKEKWELAYDDYLSGMKYKEIANKYGVSISAVKSWKSRYWKDKKLQPKKTKVATKKVAEKAAKKMIENDNEELDEERQLFCIYYLKYHNQVKAYMKIKPNTKYESACVTASRWMKEEAIRKEIKRLKQELYTEALLDPHDIIQKYIDIAFADINDYVEYGREEVAVMGMFGPVTIKNEITGENIEIKKEQNIVKLKESAYVDGSIISEIKEGKNGVSIKLADRMKALEFLSKHIGMLTPEQQAKLNLMKAQTSKVIGKEDNEEIEDDGFIAALNSTAKEDWEDYEE